MSTQKVIKILGHDVVSMDVNQCGVKLTCSDCRFNSDEYMDEWEGYCKASEFCDGVVFIDPTQEKEVHKYDLETIMLAVNQYFGNPRIDSGFVQCLNDCSDKDYREYLRLKAKYEVR